MREASLPVDSMAMPCCWGEKAGLMIVELPNDRVPPISQRQPTMAPGDCIVGTRTWSDQLIHGSIYMICKTVTRASFLLSPSRRLFEAQCIMSMLVSKCVHRSIGSRRVGYALCGPTIMKSVCRFEMLEPYTLTTLELHRRRL